MSAVVEAVVGVVESVVDVVGDAVEVVSDVVEDVVDTVGNAVEAVIEDPLPVLIAVAGQAVGIPAPITMGAITAARGGDLEDIALSMGTAAFAPSVGSAISSTVSSTFIEAGLNETFSQIASNSISQGLVNGTIAEIKGGNFEDGFAGGFTGGLVASGVSEVGGYVKDDVIALAQESGLDLKDATTLYNAGTRAVTAGVTSEVTGRGDFATSFTNSAIGSGIDYGTRSLNSAIDEQFRTAATDWNEKDKEGEPVDVATVGAGIPNELVSEVKVSEYGVDNTPETIDVATVLADAEDTSGETATSDISILPETKMAQAPEAETVEDFSDLSVQEPPTAIASVFDNLSQDSSAENIPESVIDIAETLPTEEAPVADVEPKGALTAASEVIAPTVEEQAKPAVVAEAPVSENLLTAGLAEEKPPVGGLNAVAQTAPVTPEQKMADSMGLKPTDITKPLVASVGSLLKQSLTQKRFPQRAPMRPVGGLQMAGARPAVQKSIAPPAKMDIAKLIPIQKATSVAPPKTLASTAKLSPVTNIAGLTSMLKKTG
jgi:hypothetical protein